MVDRLDRDRRRRSPACSSLTGDGAASGEYLAGFLIEKSLSLDNLFVFAVLISFFAVPVEQRHRVLVFGVALRSCCARIFIVAGAAALDAFSFVTYGSARCCSTRRSRSPATSREDVDPDKTLVMRTMRRVLPMSNDYEGRKLTTRANGTRVTTPLFAAFVMVAAFDVMFADRLDPGDLRGHDATRSSSSRPTRSACWA